MALKIPPHIAASALCDQAAWFEEEADRHFQNGKLSESIAFQQRAIKIRRQLGDVAYEADCAQNIGLLQFLLKDHEAAIASYEEALVLRQRMNDVPGKSVVLGRMADVFQHIGNHWKAISLLERALWLARKADNQANVGIILNNIGVSYRETGRRHEAMHYYEQALRILRDLGERAGLSTVLHNIGVLHLDESMFHDAREILEEARRVRERNRDYAGLNRTELCLGQLYEALGDLDLAVDHYERSWQLATHPAVHNSDDEAAALYHLGGVAITTGAADLALRFLERAHSLLFSSNQKSGLAMTQYGIGVAYQALRQSHMALQYLENAKRIQEEIGDCSGLATTLAAIGTVLSRRGEHARAYDFLAMAARMQDELGEHDAQVNTLHLLGFVCEAQGETDEALRHYRSAAILLKSRNVAVRKSRNRALLHTDGSTTARPKEHFDPSESASFDSTMDVAPFLNPYTTIRRLH